MTCIKEATQPTTFSNDAMAGKDDGQAIGPARLSYGTRSGMQLGGDIGIAARRAAGDILDGTPYPALMNRAANMHRQIEREVWISQICLQLIANFSRKNGLRRQ